jgi:hypothetical protein
MNGGRSPFARCVDGSLLLVDRKVAMSPTEAQAAATEKPHQILSPLPEDRNLERRFHELVTDWQADVAPLSSTPARVGHPAYRAIIALGPAVVPLLLRELERRPGHWFAALKALTGADPVAPSDRGRLGPMTEAWIRWGKEHGHL